ncbi:MAG: hypothetical protein E7589_01725 [Ruminococcaceae bacterium]|nr:hypothetical protein [Oscillospiraceae bacterium]
MTLEKRTDAVATGFERIDFHAHIIPRLDHGSNDVSQGKEQLARLHRAGVDTVCATSHFYPNAALASDFLAKRESSFEKLVCEMGDNARPRIILGAEVLICEGLENMDELSSLCLEGTNLLLLELPLGASSVSEAMYETALAIRDKGITPVLAHVDRYPPQLIRPLLDRGIYAQINATAMFGLFRPKHIDEWIGDGHVIALGSDYHFGVDKGVECFERLCEKRAELTFDIFRRTRELLQNAVRR